MYFARVSRTLGLGGVAGMITDENISGKVLDHLGLIAVTLEKVGLIKKIDQRLPLEKPKTTMGQRVAVVIFNGLGFVDDRLYMFPEFLHNKPVDRLFDGDVEAENFNDDALGRCLDAIYAYGTTKLLSEVAFEIEIEQGLLGRTFNIDTTFLTVSGDYEEEEGTSQKSSVQSPLDASSGAVPRHGYSKDHRPDLKQMVLNLATTGAAGFLIWMEAHSGNASDKKILYEATQRMRSFCKGLKDTPAFITVLWLTRVSEQHKVAKKLVQHLDESYAWCDLKDSYKICVTKN